MFMILRALQAWKTFAHVPDTESFPTLDIVGGQHKESSLVYFTEYLSINLPNKCITYSVHLALRY